MSRKQSHEQKLSYQYQLQTSYNHHVKSPYIELLESKKKVYGHRFDSQKHNRSYGHQPNTQPTNINITKGHSSKNIQHSKHTKSISSEKYSHQYDHRNSSGKSQIKRVYTQQNQPSGRPTSSNVYYHNVGIKENRKKSQNQKLHESLNIYSSNNTYQSGDIDAGVFDQNENNQVIDDELEHCQELSYQQEMIEEPKKRMNGNNNKDYLEELIKGRSGSQGYYQIDKYRKASISRNPKIQKNNYLKTATVKKNTKNLIQDSKNKAHKVKADNLSFDENNQKNKRKRHLSENKHIYDDSQLHNLQDNDQVRHRLNFNKIGLENLNVNDIDGLIHLIDNCVQEANQYIIYISDKLEQAKQELIASKAKLYECEQQLREKDSELAIKKEQIKKLERQLKSKSIELENANRKSRDSDNNLEIRNLLQIVEKLNAENEKLRIDNKDLRTAKETDKRDKPRESSQSDEGKIDAFNIEITTKEMKSDSIKDNKQFRELQREDLKKLKFIKPKYK